MSACNLFVCLFVFSLSWLKFTKLLQSVNMSFTKSSSFQPYYPQMFFFFSSSVYFIFRILQAHKNHTFWYCPMDTSGCQNVFLIILSVLQTDKFHCFFFKFTVFFISILLLNLSNKVLCYYFHYYFIIVVILHIFQFQNTQFL